jgi:hypothetical protein
MSEPSTNVRVHRWLTEALDTAARQIHSTRLQLNPAALWWFLNRLTPEDRAGVLGEYMKALAMLHQSGQAEGKGSSGRAKRGE